MSESGAVAVVDESTVASLAAGVEAQPGGAPISSPAAGSDDVGGKVARMEQQVPQCRYHKARVPLVCVCVHTCPY